jgi:hypothetical protein
VARELLCGVDVRAVDGAHWCDVQRIAAYVDSDAPGKVRYATLHCGCELRSDPAFEPWSRVKFERALGGAGLRQDPGGAEEMAQAMMPGPGGAYMRSSPVDAALEPWLLRRVAIPGAGASAKIMANLGPWLLGGKAPALLAVSLGPVMARIRLERM